jgi:alanyl-tRNA synthetase
LFKIIGEESVSAGTRRITAITGAGALAETRKHEAALHEIARTLKSPIDEAATRVVALAKEVRDLRKQLSSATLQSADVSVESLLASAIDVNGTKVVVAETSGADAGTMRQLIDQLRRKASPIAVLLGSAHEGKVTLVAGITRDLEARGIHAGKWIATAAEVVGGRGGGKPDMAQAGGKHPEKLAEALEAARRNIASLSASNVAGPTS